MSDAPAFAVWRRPRSRRGAAWEQLPGTHATSAAALAAISQSELTASEAEYEYAVLRDGERPQIWPPTYRHRMMSPDLTHGR